MNFEKDKRKTSKEFLRYCPKKTQKPTAKEIGKNVKN